MPFAGARPRLRGYSEFLRKEVFISWKIDRARAILLRMDEPALGFYAADKEAGLASKRVRQWTEPKRLSK